MDEQQGKPEVGEAKDLSISLSEFNLFWSSIVGIVSDFHSDVEQIVSLLQDTTVKMPSEYDENLSDKVSVFERMFVSMADKGEDDYIEYTNYDETDGSMSKRQLREIVNLSKRILTRDKRNKNFLMIISFNHLVSLFDGAMMDFAEALFKKSPYAMVPLDKGATIPTMNYLEILNAKGIEELKQSIIERELFNFGFKSLRQQIQFFNKVLTANIPSMQKQKSPIAAEEQTIGSIIEIRETRNIHVHNKGIINQQYSNKIQEYFSEVNSKIKDPSKRLFFTATKPGIGNGYYAQGDFREITSDYLNESIRKLTHLLNSIATALNEKFLSKEEIAKLEKNNQEHWERRQAVTNKITTNQIKTEETTD